MEKNSKKYLIVAIHDVTPAYHKEIKHIISILNKIGVNKKALKVIPNFLGKWNILKYPEFLEWLIEEKEKGSEIIQHGYEHLNKKPHKFKKAFLNYKSAEFSELNYEEAKKLINKGKEIFREIEIECKGFTAPTWNQSKETIHAIIDSGFLYFTTLLWIKNCKNKRVKLFLPALGYQGIAPFFERLAVSGNFFMKYFYIPYQSIIRMVLHPQNIFKNKAFNFTIKIIKNLIPMRELTTYSQLVERK